MRFTQIANACREIKATFVLKCSNGDSAHLSTLFFVLKRLMKKECGASRRKKNLKMKYHRTKQLLPSFLIRYSFN